MSLIPYSLSRSVLFRLDAETAHETTIDMLAKTQHSLLRRAYTQPFVDDPVTLCGLRFPNRVGLAAGLDKNARCIAAWEAMGFGSIEVGTVTPKGQPGNPKPRIFRLPKANALINRLGFNNEGLDAFVRNVQRTRPANSRSLLGLNIGKNASTPIEQAADDYLTCLDGVYPWADYVTVNISSPNTKNLRALQSDEALDALQKGVASEKDIDTAMRLGVNYPSGPIAWGERLGWQRLLTLLENLQRHYGEERYRPCSLLRQRALLESSYES